MSDARPLSASALLVLFAICKDIDEECNEFWSASRVYNLETFFRCNLFSRYRILETHVGAFSPRDHTWRLTWGITCTNFRLSSSFAYPCQGSLISRKKRRLWNAEIELTLEATNQKFNINWRPCTVHLSLDWIVSSQTRPLCFAKYLDPDLSHLSFDMVSRVGLEVSNSNI